MPVVMLSGILVTRDFREGNVRIFFLTHRIAGTLTTAKNKQAIGPSGSFTFPPCKIVSLRGIYLRTSEGSDYSSEQDSVQIDDTSITADYLDIEWRSTGNLWIDEISYLIIGEVPERPWLD